MVAPMAILAASKPSASVVGAGVSSRMQAVNARISATKASAKRS